MKVKGRDRTWIALVALAVVVTVAYYLLEVRGIAEESSEVEYVWELDADQIVGLRVVDNASGAATTVEKDAAGDWWVTEPTSAAARAGDCIALTYALSGLQVRRAIEEPPEEELGAYGLITPTYTIELQTGDDDQVLSLEVGVSHPGGFYYARRVGEQMVLLVPDYAVDEVTRVVAEPPVAELAVPTPGLPVVGPATPEP